VLEKLIVAWIIKNSPVFFGTWRCIAVFVLQVRKMSLAFAGESGLYLHTIIPIIYLIILLPSRRSFSLSLVLSCFTIRTLYTLLVFSMRAAYFAHRFICLEYHPAFFDCYKLWNPTYWVFHILLLVSLCLNQISSLVPLWARDRLSHPEENIYTLLLKMLHWSLVLTGIAQHLMFSQEVWNTKQYWFGGERRQFM